ncbi:MAG TPA: NAD(P)H-dependent glycerol-3-phosphate dehydrogenase [Thiobacillaceae bacterium]|nr:NAD(P)H-dependent glycerol-3-phosphate dehydrogenase [Thiobacillaceae bacterium]
MKVAVLGAGAWGTALAARLAAQAETWLWARNPELVGAMASGRVNGRYLPDTRLPDALRISADLAAATAGADYLISAVPTGGFRDLLQRLRALDAPGGIVWLCKGFEGGTGKLAHEVLAEAWPGHPPAAALSGPSFAKEVAAGLPTALTVASENAEFAHRAARDLHSGYLRLYSSTDVGGVEIGGAVKNVIAIAAGVSDGLNFGLNARAALIARGLAEMTRLGLKLGGRLETFLGLSGVGDLILTCTGDLSRNRQVGLRLARGMTLPDILEELHHVAEGVTTAREIDQLAEKLAVEMPITRTVRRILDRELSPREAVAALMNREIRDEGV